MAVMIRTCLATLVTGLTFAGTATGQIIRGRIIQDGSLRPIPHADVSLLGSTLETLESTRADSLGRFTFEIPPGRYAFQARALGFMEVASPLIELGFNEELDIRIVLSPDAILLAPLEITARSRPLISGMMMQAYHERRAKNLGFAITRQNIEERKPRRTTDLLHMVPGVHIIPRFGGSAIQMRGSGVRIRETCEVKVLLDGLVFKWGATTLDDIPVDDIEAIEVFRNLAEIPPEFGGPDALCGVVAVWTRRGVD